MVQLDYKLKNGDIEILTSPNSFGPSRDWVELVATSKAKNKMEQIIKAQDRDENIIKGHEAVISTLQDMGFVPKEFLTKSKIGGSLRTVQLPNRG